MNSQVVRSANPLAEYLREIVRSPLAWVAFALVATLPFWGLPATLFFLKSVLWAPKGIWPIVWTILMGGLVAFELGGILGAFMVIRRLRKARLPIEGAIRTRLQRGLLRSEMTIFIALHLAMPSYAAFTIVRQIREERENAANTTSRPETLNESLQRKISAIEKRGVFRPLWMEE